MLRLRQHKRSTLTSSVQAQLVRIGPLSASGATGLGKSGKRTPARWRYEFRPVTGGCWRKLMPAVLTMTPGQNTVAVAVVL